MNHVLPISATHNLPCCVVMLILYYIIFISKAMDQSCTRFCSFIPKIVRMHGIFSEIFGLSISDSISQLAYGMLKFSTLVRTTKTFLFWNSLNVLRKWIIVGIRTHHCCYCYLFECINIVFRLHRFSPENHFEIARHTAVSTQISLWWIAHRRIYHHRKCLFLFENLKW